MKDEQTVKLARIRDYLDKNGFSGMVLARQDNFNWVTSGGNNRVIVPSSEGFGVVVVTPSQVFMVSQVMDGARIMDEEMSQLKAEYIPLKWHEESPVQKAVSLAGDSPVSDIAVNGSTCCLRDIYNLHYPLTENEIKKLTALGKTSDEIITKVANEIKPGMVDYEVEAMLLYEFAKRNIQCDVLLIGTDDRIFKYRHPNPCGAKVKAYTFLAPAVRKDGLHCNITRSIYFGDTLPEKIQKAYDTVCNIEANCMSRCVTGTKWSDILTEHKQLLRKFGYESDWEGHYPGGRTGYFVSQADLSLNPENHIVNNEAYDWFITVTGAKVEELAVNHNGQFKLLSNPGVWPSKDYTSNGLTVSLPQIMMR